MRIAIRAPLASLLFFVAGAATAAAQAPIAILIPGAGGPVPSSFVMRNQGTFARAGIQTQVATSGQQAAAMAQALKSSGQRVVIVGFSLGGWMSARALIAGAPVAGVVFVSSDLASVRAAIGSAARLPPALVVHHRDDGCARTSPTFVPGFVAWSRGRARVKWVDTTGPEARHPCGPDSAHQFHMQDGSAMQAIMNFILSR